MNQIENMNTSIQNFPVLNDRYEIIGHLGEGATSKVYLARDFGNYDNKVAVKILKQEYIRKHGLAEFDLETEILSNLDHLNINSIIEFGKNGSIIKPSGRKIENQCYAILEYESSARIFFDLVQKVGAMGDQGSRFFIDQIVSAVEYTHNNYVAHRDLKLENILVDSNMNIQLIDFGFATYKQIGHLNLYRGTKTYMAPEIKESKTYDGRQTDMFSIGVILFILVTGHFPFQQAKSSDPYYSLIIQGRFKEYWDEVNGDKLSNEFKDLMQQMFGYDPKKRPTMKQLKEHLFMQRDYDMKKIRNQIQHIFLGSNNSKSVTIIDQEVSTCTDQQKTSAESQTYRQNVKG